MAVANSQVSYMPPAHLRQFENNLASIPSFFADENDAVLTRERVPQAFIEYLQKLGFKTPVFIQSYGELPADILPLNSLRPWGWSPAVHNMLKPFKPLCNLEWLKHPMYNWKPHHRLLLSRETGYRLISQIQEIRENSFDLIEIPTLPKKLSSLYDIENIIHSISPPVILKTPWSASGRGLFRIRDIHEQAENNPWVKSKLRQQGFLFAEPFLDKISDLSFHFWIDKSDVHYLGYNFFETNAMGQFLGCYTHFPPQSLVDVSILKEAIRQGSQLLKEALKKLNINEDYQGPAGIDTMVFRNKQNQIKLHPCIEINLRHSMGLLNIHLRDRIHPSKRGKWEISMIDPKTWGEMNKRNNYATNYILEDGFIAKGIIGLTPAPQKKGFMAWLKMEP